MTKKKTKDIYFQEKTSTINIVTVGNVNPDKDPLTLIKAALVLKNKFKLEPHFYIIGGQFDSQESFISNLNLFIKKNNLSNIHFLGPKDDIKSWLKACDFYICSSKFESSPISVWEAAAMGCTIITSEVGDIAELNQNNNFALTFEAEDFNALADNIAKACQKDCNFKLMQKNARKMALKYFDVPVIARNHFEVYQQ